jgi:hypothetical protein
MSQKMPPLLRGGMNGFAVTSRTILLTNTCVVVIEDRLS